MRKEDKLNELKRQLSTARTPIIKQALERKIKALETDQNINK